MPMYQVRLLIQKIVITVSRRDGLFSDICHQFNVKISTGDALQGDPPFSCYTIMISSSNSIAAIAQANLDGAIVAVLEAYGRMSGVLSLGSANGPMLVYCLINLGAYGRVWSEMLAYTNSENGLLSMALATRNGVPQPIPSSMDIILSFLGWPTNVMAAVQRLSRCNGEPNPYFLQKYQYPSDGNNESHFLGNLPTIDGNAPDLEDFWPPAHNLRSMLESFYKKGRLDNKAEDAAGQAQAQANQPDEADYDTDEADAEVAAVGGADASADGGTPTPASYAQAAGGATREEEADLAAALEKSKIDQ